MTTKRDTAGDDPRDTAECIEIRFLTGSIKSFTVATYEEGLKRASSIGTQRGLMFWELGWTRDAPPVDRLREEWKEAGAWEFRVSDLDAWAWQMGRLLGFRD
jgi:hypothetical protein